MAYQSRLELIVDGRSGERELKRFQGRLGEVDRAGDRASGSVDRVGVSAGRLRGVALAASGALVGLTGAMSVGRVVGYADAWTNTSNQIRQVTSSSEELANVQEKLVALAVDTRSGYESTANLFSRLTRSTTELGLSQQDIIDLTGTINKSFAVSGATAQEASNAITQLSQGLAAGALRGEEFNSVSEQAPDIMRAIAKSLNMGIGELRAFAAEGGITAEIVVRALQEASAEIDERFGGSIASFGQKMEVANTNLIEWVGSSEAVNGAVGVLGDSVIGLTDNIDTLVDVGAGVAVVYGGRMVGALAAATGAKLAATRQAILYQAALARMAGVSATAAASQTALAAATRGAAGALALVGGPAGAALIAVGAIYYFREELGLTQKAIGLTEQELADLRKEMAEMDGVQITQTLSQVENSLMQVGLKAAAAREELAQLRSESAGSGVLGFEGGRVGAEIRGMQAVAEYTEKMTELEQKRAAIIQESGSRAFKPLSGWLFEVADANETVTTTTTDSTKALRDALAEADRFASTIRSLEDRLFPVEAAQRTYREEQELLTLAWAKGEMGVMRYMEALNRLEQAAVGAYVESSSLSELFNQRDIAQGMSGPRGQIAQQGVSDAISGQVMQGRPGVNSLDPSLDGGFGELQRIEQERAALEAWYDERISMYQQYRELENENAAHYNDVIRQLEQQRAQDIANVQQQSMAVQMQGFEGLFGSLTDMTATFAGEQSGLYRTMFGIQKAAAIAQSIIAIQQGIAMAAANPWPINLGAMASVAAATAGLVSNIASVTMPQGMAHDGIDSVPREGTWLLDKGERVMNRPQADRLDQYLDMQERRTAQNQGNGSSAAPTINIIENPNKGGSTSQRQEQDGRWVIDVVVASITGDGQVDKAMRGKYGVQPRGR